MDAVTVSFPKILKGTMAGEHTAMVVPGWVLFNAALVATAGSEKVNLAWNAPEDPGVTGYMLRTCVTGAGGSCAGWTRVSPDATSSAVAGLRSGTGYRFELYAQSAQGRGASSFATAIPLPARSYESLALSPVPPITTTPLLIGQTLDDLPPGGTNRMPYEPEPPVNY